MAKILILGAGRSSVYFVKQVQQYSLKTHSFVTIIDQSFDTFPKELKEDTNIVFLEFSIFDTQKINSQIKAHTVVVSMLPPHLHIEIAKSCLQYKKPLLTASYVSDAMQKLDVEAKKQGVLFLNEMGVDPGLDHISALSLLDSIYKKGGKITSFKSHTGGIIAEKTLSNLWNYKITWNPENVVLAGKDGALFLENNIIKKIKYKDIFTAKSKVFIDEVLYDSYANRDSLKYIDKYHLNEVNTCYRGTLRHSGFCEAWNVFVQLGITNNNKRIELKAESTREDFLNYFLKESFGTTTEERLVNTLKNALPKNSIAKLKQLAFFTDKKKLLLFKGTAAEILQSILEESWKIEPLEKDMLLMHHEVVYTIGYKSYLTTSTLKNVGENQEFTAMAKTVGAPLFEGLLLILENKCNLTGVHIPNIKEIYEPLYVRIQKHDLIFKETTVLLHEENE